MCLNLRLKHVPGLKRRKFQVQGSSWNSVREAWSSVGGGVNRNEKLAPVAPKAGHTRACGTAVPLLAVSPMETPLHLHLGVQGNIHGSTSQTVKGGRLLRHVHQQ